MAPTYSGAQTAECCSGLRMYIADRTATPCEFCRRSIRWRGLTLAWQSFLPRFQYTRLIDIYA